jgi:hypothetical protein
LSIRDLFSSEKVEEMLRHCPNVCHLRFRTEDLTPELVKCIRDTMASSLQSLSMDLDVKKAGYYFIMPPRHTCFLPLVYCH